LIVTVGKICVVRSLFMLFGLVVFRRLFVMAERLLMVTGSVLVMLPSL
jgi:hypothetical protein